MAGEIFRRKREETGLDIKEISELLKIKADYLVSIENDLFEKLPVEVYTKGYIRCYAKYLGVDPEPVMQYYTDHLSHPKATTIIPISSSIKKTSRIFYLIPAVVIIIAGFFVFHYISRNGVSQKPATPVAISENKVTDNPVRPAVKQAVPERKGHSLYITAQQNTWIFMKVKDSKGEEIFLHPGESKKLQFPEKVFMKIGNAGGIRISLDGKDIGVPGKQGQVITLNLPEE